MLSKMVTLTTYVKAIEIGESSPNVNIYQIKLQARFSYIRNRWNRNISFIRRINSRSIKKLTLFVKSSKVKVIFIRSVI